MIKKILYGIILGAGLMACSFAVNKTYHPVKLEVKANGQPANAMDSLLLPYKSKLDAEMNRQIGTAEVSFVNAKPWGNLGNLISDVMLQAARPYADEKAPVICILNSGGLRAPISKGPVLLGDIYKVLPFDNQLELIFLQPEQVEELIGWLRRSAGHPLAGCRFKSGNLELPDGLSADQGLWVVSSDYILNGGDQAEFFSRGVNRITTGKLMRDVMISYVEQTQTLRDVQEERFKP